MLARTSVSDFYGVAMSTSTLPVPPVTPPPVNPPPCTVPPVTPPALVIDNATLLAGIPDSEVVSYLEGKGYTVTEGGDGPTPPDPGQGTLIGTFSDLSGSFVPEWASPARAKNPQLLAAADTSKGPGFDITVKDTDTTVWDNNMKAVLTQARGTTRVGQRQKWDFDLYLPSQRIATSWNGGVLIEWHTTTSSGHCLNIDNTGRPNPGEISWRIGRQNKPGQNYEYTWIPRIQFDAWSHWTYEIGWSTGNDGYIRVSKDGKKYVDFNGPTCFAGEGDPYLQYGWYADKGAGTNKVTITNVRYQNL